jgi:hypothetical protein
MFFIKEMRGIIPHRRGFIPQHRIIDRFYSFMLPH